MGDAFVYQTSNEIEGRVNYFIKKEWLNIMDAQSQNYSSNQCVIDTSQLSNSNKYMSYREAYLVVPLLLTLVGPQDENANSFTPVDGTANYALGLKNWFGTIFHSMTLDFNGTTIIQQTSFLNMWNSFRLMTTLSWADVETQGSSIGFYPDDPTAWCWSPASYDAPAGKGVCNNSNGGGIVKTADVNDAVNGASGSCYLSGSGNIGFTKRQTFINYDPDSYPNGEDSTYADFLDGQNCRNLWKSHISNKVNGSVDASGKMATVGVLQISVLATVYLKHLHSFFDNIPLLKGAFMRMTLNLNNSSSQFTITNGKDGPLTNMTLNSVINPVGGVNPLMIAAANNVAGNASGCGNLGTGIYSANISVGGQCLNPSISTIAGVNKGNLLAKSVYLYVPAYTFNPVFEQAYLSAPVKQVVYEDIYAYQILNVANNATFTNLITNGISGIKEILILPFFSSGIQGNTGLPNGIPVFQSPFDPAGAGPTSPLCLLGNFNVVVSGQNINYNQQRFSFEQFNNHLYGANAINGGKQDGLNSSLIQSLGFEMEYCYYYMDLSRMLPVEEMVSKSIQLIGTNYSSKYVDLYVFVSYTQKVSVDVLTGQRVA